jgi:adenine-specific DNA-methyltransferase
VTRVFIGGSRQVTRLDDAVRRRLSRIVEKRLPVLIGDANGADKVVQGYLRDCAFDRVEVYAADASPRNNLGRWPVRVVHPPGTRRGFEYYAAKDRAMATQATVGLMLWDGQSRGTLMNVLRMVAAGKTVAVYVQPRRAFVEVHGTRELSSLLEGLDPADAERLRASAAAEGLETSLAGQATLGL